ncbi:dihydropteroate synthase [Halovenus marina]|uniref:dihydropteroate synthase n=1 Tax=Halovenus marina TaxID=3396621 RepID=UPI003F55DF26
MRTVDAAGLDIGDDAPPRIMGVLNVSSESPYKPSVFDDPGEAAAYVDSELIDEGADIVDIGLESANKRLDVLSASEELDRLDTAVEAIESVSGDAVFSIETRYHEVAEAALERGFEMVNDICGFADPEMPRVCEDYDVAVAKMASPPDLKRPGAIEAVDDIYDALFQNGLTDKTLVDPAFGGWSEDKTLEDDRETFRRLREFRAIGQPILVSINRKNFLREIAGRDTEDALPVSLGATAMAVERGAHVVRTHDVAETRDAALVGREFTRDRLRTEANGLRIEELDAQTVEEMTAHLDRFGTPGSAAERTVTRAFTVDGLSKNTREQLSAIGAEMGLLVATAGATTLVAGTVAAIEKTAKRVSEPPELADVLGRIWSQSR